MKQLLALLFVSLLGELCWSLEASQCQNLGRNGLRTSFCCNTSSEKTCFTTFHANSSHSHPVSKPFEEASDWCKLHFRGSSLIIINSIASQRTVESFIVREVLLSETIITDAQKLSANASFEWSWVNGHPTVPMDVRTEQSHDGTCVELKREHSLAYCTGYAKEQYSYICEYSDSKSAFSHRQINKSYIAFKGNATWYDARKECLRFGGDLASITDFQTIGNWSQLKYNQRYWIGLHRNMWIWNSTGAAITYTDWDGGYPDESSDKQCICINPLCRSENNRTICLYDRKWRTCNCNHDYAIVCQTADATYATTTTAREAIGKTDPTSSLTKKPPSRFSDDQTTAFASSSASSPPPPSTGLFKSFTITEIFLILFLIVTVVFIVFIVILVIRKCKKRNERRSMKKTKQEESVSPEYETMVPDKRPSDDNVPIYTELELTQHPMPSNSTIYTKVNQPEKR